MSGRNIRERETEWENALFFPDLGWGLAERGAASVGNIAGAKEK